MLGAQEKRHSAGPQRGHQVDDQAQADQADQVNPATADVHPGDQPGDRDHRPGDQPSTQRAQDVAHDDAAAARRAQQEPAGEAGVEIPGHSEPGEHPTEGRRL